MYEFSGFSQVKILRYRSFLDLSYWALYITDENLLTRNASSKLKQSPFFSKISFSFWYCQRICLNSAVFLCIIVSATLLLQTDTYHGILKCCWPPSPQEQNAKFFLFPCLFLLQTSNFVVNFSCRDQDLICFNQSLRILSNLVAASAINYSVLNEIISELLSATASLANLKLADSSDLIAKVSFCILLQCILLSTYST